MKTLKNKSYYQNLDYNMKVIKEDNEFIAYYKEYPKITGCGDTKTEAIQDLKEAFSCLLDELLAQKETIIEPKPFKIEVKRDYITA